MNGLEALEKARFEIDWHRKNEGQHYYPKEEREEFLNAIEKELKTLEFIKNHVIYCKNVHCVLFANLTAEESDRLAKELGL